MATSVIKLNDMYVGKTFANADARTTFANIKCESRTTMDITLTSRFRGLMTVLGAASGDRGKGLFYVSSSTTGDVVVLAIHSSSDISVTSASGNMLTVANNSVVQVYINFLIMQANITDATVRT